MESAPLWLTELVAHAAEAADAIGDPAEISCHLYQNELTAEWEITLFAEHREWGGRLTELAPTPVLSIDVHAIERAFDHVTACRWQTTPLPSGDDIGAHLSVEGSIAGNTVWLRILSRKPAALNGQASPLSFLQN